MLLAFDTHYFDDKAKTVCLAFSDWAATESTMMYSEILENIEPYTSGAFYKRELPCILSLLRTIDCTTVTTIVIDGFVFLDDAQKLGLGGHLYEALGRKFPVIGVAKTNFATIEQHKKALLRGDSTKPLFITAIGIHLEQATQHIAAMHGAFRIPTLLKVLDGQTKEHQM